MVKLLTGVVAVIILIINPLVVTNLHNCKALDYFSMSTNNCNYSIVATIGLYISKNLNIPS
jgi:hypothetical protein